METAPELFEKAAERFEAFLLKEQNDKILFSGRYGSGKTTFLRHFFDKPEDIGLAAHEYILIRISPVNYSVADLNADIIELIKYDIILQFMLKGIKINTTDIPSYYFLSTKDIHSIFKTLISLVNVKGIELSSVVKGLEELKKGLDERKKNADEGDIFMRFLDRLEDAPGVFERDIVTKTIGSVLQRLTKEGKRPVLVIDDFDRLDPEHTFRILNIFSSHFDDDVFYQKGLKNKFGFDKVIIVCDYQNIQSLYHNRYGSAADFGGYIDKFYSSSVFEFDVKKEVRKFVRNLLLKIDVHTRQQYGDSIRYFGGRSDDVLEQSIVYGVLSGLLALRTLSKLAGTNVERNYPEMDRFFSSKRNGSYSLFLLKLNLFLFGGSTGYIQLLEKLFSYNYPILMDSYTLDLIVATEELSRPYKNETSVIIRTALHKYSFEPSGINNNSASSIKVDFRPRDVDAELTLDLMKHFLLRLEQINIVE